ncbi:1022_t:CDS:2, partial [Ambispora leptoticha]
HLPCQRTRKVSSAPKDLESARERLPNAGRHWIGINESLLLKMCRSGLPPLSHSRLLVRFYNGKTIALEKPIIPHAMSGVPAQEMMNKFGDVYTNMIIEVQI